MKNAIFVIQLGGTQHLVKAGDTISVNHIEGKVGDKVTIPDVLLMQSDEALEIGKPSLNYSASAEIVRQYMDTKVDVFKYKAKSRYRKTHGHRQFLTALKIQKFSSAAEAKASKTVEKAVKDTKTSSKKK